jgi:hypothetical protein
MVANGRVDCVPDPFPDGVLIMRGTLPTLLTVLTVLALMLPMAASAQVYKWKDAHGTTHFSETPPPQGVKYQSIHTRVDADQPRAPAPGKADQNKDADTGSTAAKGRSPQLKRFCAQLESNIALLKSNQSLQRMGSDGKTAPVNDRVRAQQLKQQQLRYNAYCKDN